MRSNKKKLLIVLSIDEYIRNYLRTNAFKDLEKEFQCYYLGSENLHHKSELEVNDNFVGYYSEDVQKNIKSYEYFNILMYKYKHLSSSFSYRIKRALVPSRNVIFHDLKIIFSELKRKKLTHLNKYIRYYRIKLFSKGILTSIYKKRYEKSFQLNRELENAVEKIKPEMILFPSSAYDPIGIDIIKICKQKNIKSFFLIDNWDNLSSKSILFEKPDYLGVWSEQTKKHACEIQNYDESRISIIGTPRFDHYFELREKTLTSHFSFPYILFVGSFLQYEESMVIRKLNKMLSDDRDLFHGAKVVYRPHPWRLGGDDIIDETLENVELDPQIKDKYLLKDRSSSFQPNLNYYPALIKNADIVIGGLSSMLVECLIFRKPYLGLIYDDGKIMSPKNVYENYEHYRGIEKLDSMHFCSDLNQLREDLIKTKDLKNNIDFEELDKKREYFIYRHPNRTYSENLSYTIKERLK